MSIALVTRLVSQLTPAAVLGPLHTFVTEEIAIPLRQLIKSYNAFAKLANEGYIEIGGARLYFQNNATTALPTDAPEGSLLINTDPLRGLWIYTRQVGFWVPIV